MKLLSIEYIPGAEIEALGMVKGTIVQTKNVGKDFMAGMKTLVGGEIVGYTQMLEEARQIAVKRMVDEAKALGADAIIGVRYGSSQLMAGAAEVIAYGTAVRILNKKERKQICCLIPMHTMMTVGLMRIGMRCSGPCRNTTSG